MFDTSSNAHLLCKVLVPGAGLARLAFDIARAGYATTGNEFSFFMLFASSWVLNQYRYPTSPSSLCVLTTFHSCPSINAARLCPYVHQVCNVVSASDMFRTVTVPDVCPSDFGDELMARNFSMAVAFARVVSIASIELIASIASIAGR